MDDLFADRITFSRLGQPIVDELVLLDENYYVPLCVCADRIQRQ